MGFPFPLGIPFPWSSLGWSDVIGEVPRCLSVQTTVRDEVELESDPLWHVQPVQFVVQECRQTTIELPRVADYTLSVTSALEVLLTKCTT